MITTTGPKVLEYNVRFGDPETQTLLPLISQETDLAEIIIACTDHWLDAVEIEVIPKFSTTVVAVAGGYPGPYVKGDEIQLEGPASDTMLFHAGTSLSNGTLRTAGGRVIAATSTGFSLEDALQKAYAGVSTIKFPHMHFRKDIGHRALAPPASLSTATQTVARDLPDALTYASAGVSISSGNDLVKRIMPLVKSTARPGADAEIGQFGGGVDLVAAGYTQSPFILGAIDGVGTKLSIAHAMGKHDTVGIDCVAMNVNDLIVQGAEPLFFLDCYTCGKLDVDIAVDFVKGVAQGCIDAGCALAGGETAEMPGFFSNGDVAQADGGVYDAVGAAIGAVKQGCKILPDKENMTVGDMLIGLTSSGCHSNGFSLVRKIIDRAGVGLHDQAPWDTGKSVGEALLTPTRIYVRPLLQVVRQDLVKGMAHITGGGLIENIPRMLPKHLAAKVDVSVWQLPPVFQWLRREGNIDNEEFARTFNSGIGMVLVVSDKNTNTLIERLRDAGETVWKIGKLISRRREGCLLEGLHSWH